MTTHTNLAQGSVSRTLRNLTLPTLLGSATLILFNLVDTWYISLLGSIELAAISFTFPVTLTVISLTLGLGVGTSALVARLLGEGRTDDARRLASDALLLVILVVGLIAYLGWHWIDPIFSWLGADRFTLAFIRDYMQLWFPGSLLLIVPMTANSVLRAFGNMKLPSLLMAAGGLINAILDPLLIFGLGPFPAMGIRGAVTSSILSWLITATAVFILLRRRQFLVLSVPPLGELLHSWRQILQLAIPASGASLMTPVSLLLITWLLARFGPESVAAWGVGSRLESIMMLLTSALCMTLPPFVSQNLGADQPHRIRRAIRRSFAGILLWQFVLYLLVLLMAGQIAYWFSDTWDVRLLIERYIWLVPLSFGAQGVVQISISVLNAMHLPQLAMQLTLVRLFGLMLPASAVLGIILGTTGVYLGVMIANFVSAHKAWRLVTQACLEKERIDEQTI